MALRLIALLIITSVLFASCGKTDTPAIKKDPKDSLVANCRILTISNQNNVTQMLYDTNGINTGYKVTDTVYNLLQRKYTFQFNLGGQLIDLPAYKSPDVENFFSYNTDGTLGRIVYFIGSSSTGYDVYVYNASKQPIAILKYDQNSGKMRDSIAIKYDSRGNVIRTWEGLKNTLQDSAIYQYDTKNNYYSGLSYNYIILRQDFIYWGPNNATKKIIYNGSTGQITISADYSYTYNTKNYPVTMLTGTSANSLRKFTYLCK